MASLKDMTTKQVWAQAVPPANLVGKDLQNLTTKDVISAIAQPQNIGQNTNVATKKVLSTYLGF